MQLTKEMLNEIVDYDKETGILKWKIRDAKWFKNTKFRSAIGCANNWNSKNANKIIKTKHSSGYLELRILGKKELVHRIIWILETGYFPEEIDHENGNRTDNRWINLRECNRSINGKNIKLHKDNTSGVIGVNWNKKANKWRSEICVNLKRIHLGYFSNLEDAKRARQIAEIKYGFHPNHGRN